MVNDPNAIKDIVMQPKNPKSKDFQDKTSYLFGQRYYYIVSYITKWLKGSLTKVK